MTPTDVSRYSVSEIRAIARRNSRSGMEADAQSVARASADHAAGIAELDRDIGVLMTRWTGEAATGSLAVMRDYVKASYLVDRESAGVERRLTALAVTAGTTNEKFSDLAEPGIEWRDLKFWDPHNDSAGAQVAAEFRSTYSAPVQADASEMPLAETVRKVGFEMPEGAPSPSRSDSEGRETGSGDGANGGGGAGDGDGRQSQSQSGETGGASDNGAGDADPFTGSAAPDATTTGGDAARTGESANSGQGVGTGSGAGAGTGAGTGGGVGGDANPGAARSDIGTGQDDLGYEQVDAAGAPMSSLLTPAASVPTSSAGRGVGGLSGGRGGVGSTASPLGLRQDSPVARGGAPAATTVPSSGARASGPYGGGMPPAGAGGRRGEGDGRHRTPAYLIDRANGEEVVGEMPLVGPSVIGQWRNDESPRPPGAPAPPRPR